MHSHRLWGGHAKVACQQHGIVVFGRDDLEDEQEDLVEKRKEESAAV